MTENRSLTSTRALRIIAGIEPPPCGTCGHVHDYRPDPETNPQGLKWSFHTWRFCTKKSCPPHVYEQMSAVQIATVALSGQAGRRAVRRFGPALEALGSSDESSTDSGENRVK